jgi:2-oxoisovalerate dehydrogenase E1 component beta subunit
VRFGPTIAHPDADRLSYSVEQVPIDEFRLPLSSAEILTSGTDLTIVSYGSPLYTISNALSLLANPPESISTHVHQSLRSAKIELIDLRTILPWDVDTVVNSVRKTGRCMVVHEAGPIGSVSSEIASEVQKRCFEKLEAPVRRVCGWE